MLRKKGTKKAVMIFESHEKLLELDFCSFSKTNILILFPVCILMLIVLLFWEFRLAAPLHSSPSPCWHPSSAGHSATAPMPAKLLDDTDAHTFVGKAVR